MYCIFLKVHAVKTSYYSFLQENQIKAEEFYFQNNQYDVVIVGSSMAQGIHLLGLKANTHTLNFIGGGSITGLELIKRKNNLPKAIIVETNWIERPLDYHLTRPLFNRSYYALLTHLPFLQERNHPINVLTGKVSSITRNIDVKKAMNYVPFNMQRNVYFENNYVDTVQIKESTKLLRNYIHYFQKKGVKMYLMELPAHQDIFRTKRNMATRRYINNSFKDISRIPLYPQQLDSLQTYDGNHLVETSREKYSAFLTKFLINHKNDWDRNP